MDFNEKSEADYLLDYVESEVISEEFIAAATTSPAASKEATELLLESISNTSPDEVFDEEAIISSGVVGDLTEELVVKPLSELADFSRDEDVKAVLAASGQAAAEAEASMPPELIRQLEFVASNGTSSMELESVPDILKAAAVVGEPVTSTKVNAPKVSKILMFAIPAIGVWLCGPLLSLIDTSAVGLLSGTVQQAALNPAVAVTDYAALLIVSCAWLHLELWPMDRPLTFTSPDAGLFVHGCNQLGGGCTGSRSRNSKQAANNQGIGGIHATFDVCWHGPWDYPLCLCKAFVEGYHWERRHQPCRVCRCDEIRSN